MDTFETYRAYLFSIAYRMLGSAMDAEDMVQETYLRSRATPPDTIASPRAFLTTITVRLCMDQLQLARRKRETYVGPWLPEPIRDVAALQAENPAERLDVAESVSMAFMVLLERLQPVERAVFLLREVFVYEYAEIATFLGKSEMACRQALRRAKKHLADHRPSLPASRETRTQMRVTFRHAVQSGDMDVLMKVLSADVVLWADGGGKDKGAATRPVSGAIAVAQFTIGATQRFLPAGARVAIKEVNGELAIVVRNEDRAYFVLTIAVWAQRIHAVRIIANPEKLAHV